MKRIKKIVSAVLAASMFLSNAAYAGELVDTEAVSAGILSTVSYSADKIKNTVANMSILSEETDGSEPAEPEFQDPGKVLDKNDMKALYDMGYSMADISNAIKLSEQCDETPYEILLMKGLRSGDSEAAFGLASDEDTSISGSIEETTWQEVKQELELSEDVDVQENSEILYEGASDDVSVIFDQLGIGDILKENGFLDSEIEEAIEKPIYRTAPVKMLKIPIQRIRRRGRMI